MQTRKNVAKRQCNRLHVNWTERNLKRYLLFQNKNEEDGSIVDDPACFARFYSAFRLQKMSGSSFGAVSFSM